MGRLIETNLGSFLEKKRPDCILYADDGARLKIHKECFSQTQFMRNILAATQVNCCDTIEIFCPCPKEDLEHLVTFIYGGEIQRLEENEGFKIIDNLIKIFGFPKDLRQKCPIEQSDNWNFDTISIYDENEGNTSDNDESQENSFVFEKTLIETAVEHLKIDLEEKSVENTVKSHEKDVISLPNFDSSSVSNENEANTLDEEEPFENIGSLEPSSTDKSEVEHSKAGFDQKFLEFLTKSQEEENTSLPNNQNIEKEPMDISGSDANDYLFENIFSIAQSDEEAGQSKTDVEDEKSEENSAKNQEENANSLPNDESFILKSVPRKEPMVFESKMNQLKKIKGKSSQKSEKNNALWSDGDIFTAESIYGKRQRNG